jgi:outer membrane protein assembly factor BamB
MLTRRQWLRRVGCGLTAGLAGGLAGCAAAPRALDAASFDPLAPTPLADTATVQFRGGLRNRGFVDATVPPRVRVDWTLPVNSGTHTAAKSTPVAVGGDVVVAGDTGELRRVSPDGEVRWRAAVEPTTRGIHGTPAVANGQVYVGAYDGAMYAFDLATGRRAWRTDIGDAIGSSPVYLNGVCYIAVEYAEPSGSVAAVDTASGAVRWLDGWPTDHPHSTLALDRDAGRLVVGANDGVCYAWSFPKLERAWTFETGGAIKGPVAVHDGLAIFGSWDHQVYALSLDDGSEVWSFEADADVMSGPAVANGQVYVGSHDSRLYALDAASGAEQWRFDTDGWLIGSVTATRDHVLVGSYDARLYAVDASSGEEAWHVTGRGHATSAAFVTDDAVYYAERATDRRVGLLYRLVPA